MVAGRGIEPLSLAYEASGLIRYHQPAMSMVGIARIELTPGGLEPPRLPLSYIPLVSADGVCTHITLPVYLDTSLR